MRQSIGKLINHRLIYVLFTFILDFVKKIVIYMF